jgi:PDZ domain-containing secreted protein
MKSKIAVSIVIALLLLGLMQVTIYFTPVVFSDPGAGRKEIWRVVSVENTQVFDTSTDINVTVSSRNGVYVACSTNIT